ncbi:MAG TPA: hypothetical protein VKN82_03060 [Desulfohalobiaceae bacterium]|nr:hypothetical protein [Desulfohalobiaceae bacterium]
MAKSKKKITKKKKKQTSSRLESKLLSYWFAKKWGEFVTLYLRHWSRASQTQAGLNWDKAVHNFIVQILFQDKDISSLNMLLNTMQQAPELNQENQDLFKYIQALCNYLSGKPITSELFNLPENVPPAFLKLKNSLMNDLQKNDQRLDQYLTGKRKKAKKGEKVYSDLAKWVHQSRKLLQDNFSPSSLTSITTWRNSLEQIDRLVETKSSSSKPLHDGLILAELIRKLYSPSKTQNLSQPSNVLKYLYKREFSFSKHPFTQDMSRLFINIGSQRFGLYWLVDLEYTMHKKGLSLLAKSDRTSSLIQSWFKTVDETTWNEDPFFGIYLTNQELLKNNQLCWREQFVLRTVQISIIQVMTKLVNNPSFYLFSSFSSSELGTALFERSTAVIQHIINLQTQWLPDQLLHDNYPLNIWEAILSNLVHVLPSANFHTFFFKDILQHPLPDRTILFLLASFKQTGASIKKWPDKKDQTSTLKPSAQEIQELVSNIFDWTMFEDIIEDWFNYLEPKGKTLLAEEVITRMVQDTVQVRLEESNWDASWENCDISFFKKLAPYLEENFPYFCLVNMISLNNKNSLPGGKKVAETFWQNLPDDLKSLWNIFFVLIGLPKTPYGSSFLAQLFDQIKEYIHQNCNWYEVVDAVIDYKCFKLGAYILETWEEDSSRPELSRIYDFLDALNDLSNHTPRQQKIKTQTKKK